MSNLVLTSEEVEVILSHRRNTTLRAIGKSLTAIEGHTYGLKIGDLSSFRCFEKAIALRKHADDIIKHIHTLRGEV